MIVNGKTYRHDVHGWWRVFDTGSVGVNHVVSDALDEIARLRAFIRDQPCECCDEYGQRKPQICDRCRLLGEGSE